MHCYKEQSYRWILRYISKRNGLNRLSIARIGRTNIPHTPILVPDSTHCIHEKRLSFFIWKDIAKSTRYDCDDGYEAQSYRVLFWIKFVTKKLKGVLRPPPANSFFIKKNYLIPKSISEMIMFHVETCVLVGSWALLGAGNAFWSAPDWFPTFQQWFSEILERQIAKFHGHTRSTFLAEDAVPL